MDKDIVRVECARIIQKLKEEYARKSSAYGDMREWVSVNISDSRDKKSIVNRREIYYKDCLIEYQPTLMIFNIYKGDELDPLTGMYQGSVYDVSLCVKVYLKQIFGSSNFDFLQHVLFLTDIDIRDVSDAVAVDIDRWCTSIDDVFKALS